MYIHTYMHTFIHMYAYTYVHTYIHMYTYTYIHTYIHTFDYSHTCTRGSCRARSSFGCVSAPALRRTALDRQKHIRPAVRWRSGSRFFVRLGSSGRSRDAPGTLRGSIFEAQTTVSSTFVALGVHASPRPPDPYETLRGRTNFKLRACCEGPNIGRKLASNAARRRVRAGNALDKGLEASQEGQLSA